MHVPLFDSTRPHTHTSSAMKLHHSYNHQFLVYQHYTPHHMRTQHAIHTGNTSSSVSGTDTPVTLQQRHHHLQHDLLHVLLHSDTDGQHSDKAATVPHSASAAAEEAFASLTLTWCQLRALSELLVHTYPSCCTPLQPWQCH